MDWKFLICTIKLRLQWFLLAFYFELSIQAPVFFRNKGVDLILSVTDDAKSNWLHSSSTQTSFDLCPEKRADAVTHHTIQHSSCLLCVYKIHIQISRLFDWIFDRSLSNFIKGNSAHLGRVFFQCLHQMPGNCFSFTVRVSCQVNFFSWFCFFF